jgi:hypothetical protein
MKVVNMTHEVELMVLHKAKKAKEKKMGRISVFLISDRTGYKMKPFLKTFEGMENVLFMPKVIGNDETWHFIRNGMNAGVTIFLYALESKARIHLEHEIEQIKWHFHFQSISNIYRVILDDGRI